MRLSEFEQSMVKHAKRTVLNCLICFKIQGRLSIDILQKGLEIVQKRHYRLNVSVLSEKGKEPKYVFQENAIPIRYVEQVTEEQSLKEAVNELNIPFDLSKAPLARVVLVKEKDLIFNLIFVFNHIIGDGISGTIFMRDLLKVCGQLLEGKEISKDEPFHVLPIDQGFPETTHKPIVGTMPKQLYVPEPIGEETYVPASERTANFIKYTFSKAETESIRLACKKNEVSFHGVICAAALISLKEKIDFDLKIDRPTVISCYSPINTRGFYNPVIPIEQLGIWAGVGTTIHKIEKNTSFFDLAKEINFELKSVVDNRSWLTVFQRLFKDLDKEPDDFGKMHEHKTPYISVSNLGDMNNHVSHDYNSIGIQEIFAAASRQYTQATKWEVFLVPVTFNGKLTISFNFVEQYMDKKNAQAFIDVCVEKLKNI